MKPLLRFAEFVRTRYQSIILVSTEQFYQPDTIPVSDRKR